MSELVIPDSYVKLAQAGQFGQALLIPEKVDIDEAKMCCYIPWADGTNRDGGGDVTEVGGIVCDRHRMNPIVLLDHGKTVTLPIALSAEWDESAGKFDLNKYTVQIDTLSKTAGGNAFFYRGKGIASLDRNYDHALLCEQTFHMLATGLLRGGSFGYLVIDAKPLQADYSSGKPHGLHLLRTLLLEYGPTVLPMNADTVRKTLCKGYQCCGKPLSPVLFKSLSVFAEPTTKRQVGYEGKTMCQCSDKSQCHGAKNFVHGEQIEFMSGEDGGKWKPGVVDSETEGLVRIQTGQGVFIRRPKEKVRIAQKSQVAGDLNWLKEEESEIEHRKMLKGLRKKYKKDVVPVPITGNLSRTDVPPPAADPGWISRGRKTLTRSVAPTPPVEEKSLSALRLKYRRAKRLVRHLKHSSAGRGMIYVANKDMDAVRDMADKKGLKLEWAGTRGKSERVRLHGDDAAIYEIAKAYGRRK